jgi:hypothetical protein
VTTIAQTDVRLTAAQVTAYHALRRQVANLGGDAELCRQLGMGEVADAMEAAGAVLDRVSAEFIAAAQRAIIVPSEVRQ